jgi:predicted dinucleotide-binding enzyme
MQNVNLWLAVDRLRAVAGDDPETARELSELIELIRALDGTHAGSVPAAG